MTEITIETGITGAPWRADLCDRGGERTGARVQNTDDRYRRLLGEAAWFRLPPAIRRRFSKARRAGDPTVYRGHLERTELTIAGRLVAQALRLIGAPLPLDDGTFAAGTLPAIVVVQEMDDGEGQLWTRLYSRHGRFPQVISSAKRFTGETGLEEHLGHGVVMRLRVAEDAGALVFRNAGYHVRIGRFRIGLPELLSPGACEIVHRAAEPAPDGQAAFTFALTLTHPLLGRLVHQVARFTDDQVGGRTALSGHGESVGAGDQAPPTPVPSPRGGGGPSGREPGTREQSGSRQLSNDIRNCPPCVMKNCPPFGS